MKMTSVQQCREIIRDNGGALRAADGEFFADVEARFNALKNKAAHPADFRRLSNDVRGWISNLTNKPKWDATKDQPAYDGALAWNNLIDREIENRVVAENAVGSARGIGNGWRNVETGAPVALAAPDEKLSNGARSDVTVGSYLAGMLLGSKSGAIKAALSEGTDSAGGYSVPTVVLREFFDKLRAKSVFVQAGARTLILDSQKTKIVRTASDPVPAWRAENAAIGESQPSFEPVDFNARSLAVLVKASWEVLADSLNIEQALETALIGALSAELDRASLFGAGSATEPLGLFGTTNVGSVSLGTNGAQLTNWDPFVDGLYEIELDNAGPATAAIYHPRTARTLRKLKDTTNQPLLPPQEVSDLKRLVTTSVPINQTQGTETAASTILLGDFTQGILGIRESLNIQRLDQLYAGNGQVGFIAHLRADVGFAHPESFAKIIGVKP